MKKPPTEKKIENVSEFGKVIEESERKEREWISP